MLTSRNAVCGPESRGNATGWLSLVVAVRQPQTAWPRPDLGLSIAPTLHAQHRVAGRLDPTVAINPGDVHGAATVLE